MKSKRPAKPTGPVVPSGFTFTLTAEQSTALTALLERDRERWVFFEAPYAVRAARRPGLTVVLYQSGKLVVQGKGAREFVEFTLEPEILGAAKLGYEEVHAPEQFEPHVGLDESGKGDFFGPLVIAAVYVEPVSARALLEAGVCDSKRIGSEQRIRDLAEGIRKAVGRGRWSVISIGPERYNQMYKSFANLNKLLAWGHATALENVLEVVPDCPRALADQFGNKQLILSALKKKGQAIQLDQRTKAESDIAVAAASILARERFLDELRKLGQKVSCVLPKGASAQVVQTAKKIFQDAGIEQLINISKQHFKTFAQVTGTV